MNVLFVLVLLHFVASYPAGKEAFGRIQELNKLEKRTTENFETVEIVKRARLTKNKNGVPGSGESSRSGIPGGSGIPGSSAVIGSGNSGSTGSTVNTGNAGSTGNGVSYAGVAKGSSSGNVDSGVANPGGAGSLGSTDGRISTGNTANTGSTGNTGSAGSTGKTGTGMSYAGVAKGGFGGNSGGAAGSGAVGSTGKTGNGNTGTTGMSDSGAGAGAGTVKTGNTGNTGSTGTGGRGYTAAGGAAVGGAAGSGGATGKVGTANSGSVATKKTAACLPDSGLYILLSQKFDTTRSQYGLHGIWGQDSGATFFIRRDRIPLRLPNNWELSNLIANYSKWLRFWLAYPMVQIRAINGLLVSNSQEVDHLIKHEIEIHTNDFNSFKSECFGHSPFTNRVGSVGKSAVQPVWKAVKRAFIGDVESFEAEKREEKETREEKDIGEEIVAGEPSDGFFKQAAPTVMKRATPITAAAPTPNPAVQRSQVAAYASLVDKFYPGGKQAFGGIPKDLQGTYMAASDIWSVVGNVDFGVGYLSTNLASPYYQVTGVSIVTELFQYFQITEKEVLLQKNFVTKELTKYFRPLKGCICLPKAYSKIVRNGEPKTSFVAGCTAQKPTCRMPSSVLLTIGAGYR